MLRAGNWGRFQSLQSSANYIGFNLQYECFVFFICITNTLIFSMFWFYERNKNFYSEASRHLGIPLRHYLPGLCCALDRATAAPSCGWRRVKKCPGLLWEHRKKLNNSHPLASYISGQKKLQNPHCSRSGQDRRSTRPEGMLSCDFWVLFYVPSQRLGAGE